MSNDFDVAVVGAGVTGLTAAQQVAERGLRVIVIDRAGVGGQISTIERITNFPTPGYPTAGYELGVQLMDEAEEDGAEIHLAEVGALSRVNGGFLLSLGGSELSASAVVVAAGSTRLPLGVDGEQEFNGRGVSHCASCDGPLYRGRRVVVVGGGDSAFDEAAVLAEFVDEVILVHEGVAPTARIELVRDALAHPNVQTVPHSTISEIRGAQAVTEVVIRDAATGTERVEPADGVFVYIGLSPNTEWLAGALEVDADGRIVVDGELRTSIPGIFAAGDIRQGSAALLSESVSDGKRVAGTVAAYFRAAGAGSLIE